jgi:hypothetical protein
MAGLALTLGCSLATAQVRFSLTAAEMFALAEQVRSAKHAAEAEILYRALDHDPDLDVRSEARFRLGTLQVEQGHYRDAAVTFRRLLDEKPDATRVRLELARVMARMGDGAGARRELRQARSAGLPPNVAVMVDQFANTLRSTKSIGGSLEVSLAPDTNITRGTSARTLDTTIAPLILNDDVRANAGLGFKIGAQGYVRTPVSLPLALISRVSTSAALYGQGSFNDVSVAVDVGPEWTQPKGRLRVSAGAGLRYYGGAQYARTLTGSTDWLHAIGRRSQLTAGLSVSRARYPLSALQDGTTYDGTASLEHAITARAGGSVSVTLTRQTARDAGYAATSGGFGALIWRDAGRATFYGSLSVRGRVADARLTLYRKVRSDRLFRLSGGVSFRRLTLFGMAPILRAGYERNHSTVGLYDYRRLSTDIGIIRAF